MIFARKLILLLLVVMLTVQGCAGSLRCLNGTGHDDPLVGSAVGDDDGGLTQVRGSDVRAAIYAVVGIVIIGAFIADLFILPWSCYHHRHYFPCCTEVIHWCH